MDRADPATPAVHLRAVRPADRERFTEWLRQPDVYRHYTGAAPGDASREAPAGHPPRHLLRAIEDAGGRLLGWIELRDVNWRRRTGELRICLGDPATWGRGYGQQAIRLFLGQAFGAWRLTGVHLRVATWNTRAVRAYERCGFRREARLCAGDRRKDGLQDLWLMTAVRGTAGAAP